MRRVVWIATRTPSFDAESGSTGVVFADYDASKFESGTPGGCHFIGPLFRSVAVTITKKKIKSFSVVQRKLIFFMQENHIGGKKFYTWLKN